MIQEERIQALNGAETRPGRYVLYWMQQSQRAVCNHALEYAVRRANEIGLPVLAVFGITQRFPGASERHYRFMLEGLREARTALAERGIRLVVRALPPAQAVPQLAADAALLVTDRGYLRVQKRWRRRVAEAAGCRAVQVEGDVVVPVHTASDKEQYAARTVRPRIEEQLDRFLVPLEATEVERDSLGMDFQEVNPDGVDALLARLRINRDVRPVRRFRGGYGAAKELLDDFVSDRLCDYDDGHNRPGAELVSHMSPYLHFGQISPLQVALAVEGADVARRQKDAYLEELIVRRELCMNFCEFNTKYDSFNCLPDWARETLRDHAGDSREHKYGPMDLEAAETHDPCWNAAQREMALTGKMHGYMRMYWGKKILEWMPDPEEAFQTALCLNNRYELDGRDPNSYGGVAWCFGKHDQAWGERPVFGKVRYMNAAGLERKFDMDAYLRRVNDLAAREGEE